ncbi:MAG: GbsR/MarR family transcriptional regulator [Planktomarina sp.]
MYLTPSMQSFILHWGEMGSKWGVNRSVSQVHALLHISPTPMTAEEICETLSLARSNVSTALKELQAWGLVHATRNIGDRRDHFHSVRDMFDLVNVVVEGRRQKEYLPTLNALRDVAKDAETDATPPEVQKRINETLETMQVFDDWYKDVSLIPRSVQKILLRLGAKVTRFIPKSD